VGRSLFRALPVNATRRRQPAHVRRHKLQVWSPPTDMATISLISVVRRPRYGNIDSGKPGVRQKSGSPALGSRGTRRAGRARHLPERRQRVLRRSGQGGAIAIW
jgi:hypothetical protein